LDFLLIIIIIKKKKREKEKVLSNLIRNGVICFLG
jgi:hypothetical protein